MFVFPFLFVLSSICPFIFFASVLDCHFKKVGTPTTAVQRRFRSKSVPNPRLLMPPKVPALPREAIERALYMTGVPAQDIRALLRSDDWHALELPNQQVPFPAIL
jgi:hypothetical protein